VSEAATGSPGSESALSFSEGQGVASILVVDDESSMRFLLRTTLELAGHVVEEASNGQVAVERIEGGRIPDLIATDFMMPLMNGGELIARLRRNPATETIPIILVSSSPGSERRTTANAFFRKPFDPMALTQCVAELLESRR
jgi:CheY-like chemotaxis protein